MKALRQSDAIIRNNRPEQTAFHLRHDPDRPRIPAGEPMLDGIGQQFVDEQAKGNGLIERQKTGDQPAG